MSQLISHWSYYVEGQQFSSEQFYKEVGEEIGLRSPDATKVSTVELFQSHAFGDRRTYLRVRRKDLTFDVCAAPYGTGFFFSWWLIREENFLLRLIRMIPFVGPWLIRLLWPITYFVIDNMLMFQEVVRTGVNQSINTFLTGAKLQPLTVEQARPTFTEILNQKRK